MRETFRKFHANYHLPSLRARREAVQNSYGSVQKIDPLANGFGIGSGCENAPESDGTSGILSGGLDPASCSEAESDNGGAGGPGTTVFCNHGDFSSESTPMTLRPPNPRPQARAPSPALRIAGQRRTRQSTGNSLSPSAKGLGPEYRAKRAKVTDDTSLTSQEKRKEKARLDRKRRKQLKKTEASSLSKSHGEKLLFTAAGLPAKFVDVTELFEDKKDIRWIGQTGEKRREIQELIEAAYKRLLRTEQTSAADQPAPVRDIPPDAKEFSYILNDNSVAQLITDRDGRILVVKVRPPAAEWYERAVKGTSEQLRKLHTELGPDSGAKPTPGRATKDFKSTNFGFSFGGGQTVPGFMKLSEPKRRALLEFAAHHDVVTLARHIQRTSRRSYFNVTHRVAGCFKFWYPALFEIYERLVKQLSEADKVIGTFFPGFVFCASTTNTGGRVATPPHIDAKNIVFGMCSVMAFGNFDHTTSGQLVLEELKVILEFRAGDLIFLPSALITHYNLPINGHEWRDSWACYTAGGLMRWAAAGNDSVERMKARGDTDGLCNYTKHAQQYAEMGWGSFLNVARVAAMHGITVA